MTSRIRTWSDAHSLVVVVATALSVAFGHAGWLAAAGIGSLLGATAWFRRGSPWGLANALTLIRPPLVAIAYMVWDSLPAVGVAAIVALALDGLDGWIARRRREASTLGAQLDMEADALITLLVCLALLLAGRYAGWILVPGLLRYAYALTRVVWGREPDVEPRSSWGRVIFVVLLTSLVASCFVRAPAFWLVPATGSVLVLGSFVKDFWRLFRMGQRVREA